MTTSGLLAGVAVGLGWLSALVFAEAAAYLDGGDLYVAVTETAYDATRLRVHVSPYGRPWRQATVASIERATPAPAVAHP